MLEVKNLSYRYNDQTILKNINYSFEKGKIYSIVGVSGVGKSTFLSLISGLEFLQEGQVFYNQNEVSNYVKYRKSISYIFQSFNLVSYLSAIDNIKLGLAIHQIKDRSVHPFIQSILNQLDIKGENQTKKSAQLSGGQQQRVSIARAVALDSDLIIADEPTGNLDRGNAKEVMNLFKQLKEKEKCIIVVTHDPIIEQQSDVVLTIKEGQLFKLN
ncbi:hypothetical protein BCR24_13115 [Enterococcus ureilyticus]|uniref:ABC transporter domain-containing protein n=1 Tax=Enterococcus ureilyticus TaxID=1131292 RepID=A0A1E5HDQ8_9ENTE|nr:ABC transporter ATP-binding protein [Enterococcus ureilyticus]MBM7689825.1 putative ABC transport system ATP-binding protein [Enterococcus ureilyticus]MBO0447725.1 ABC transporter ATP-binding protein [Enterococcus ureilyticus]OEG23087.1 hypothetical protein BCR24_13115 [Enterococcus ureilyticus]